MDEASDPEYDELWSSRALIIVLMLLVVTFWMSYYLKVRRIKLVHETLVALFFGMIVGAIVRIAPGEVVQSMISFKSTILMNVLLPPIVLNSGYEMKQERFFRNFGVILTFAFAGTFISAVVLGLAVYVYSLLGLEGLSLTIIECLQFGSTLSATDPVTVLAIFNTMHVDPNLYSIIFGESMLNDAVSIVMFDTLSRFDASSLHVWSMFHGTGIFLLTFCISMALGVAFGLVCSLMLKHSQLVRFTDIETCLVFLIAYSSYFFSNALAMSGIVSLLFCGVTLKHYAYHNMSRKTRRMSRYMFSTLAMLSENFIFIYLGLSLFTQTTRVFKPLFILVAAIGVCLARYAAVFPISAVINVVMRYLRGRAALAQAMSSPLSALPGGVSRPSFLRSVIAAVRGTPPPGVVNLASSSSDDLPHSYQMMLFWAGLRGAVGVALATGIQGPNSQALQSAVLVVVVLSMIVFGGTIARMIDVLGIRTGIEEDNSASDDDYELMLHAIDSGSLPISNAHTRGAKPALGSPDELSSEYYYATSSAGSVLSNTPSSTNIASTANVFQLNPTSSTTHLRNGAAQGGGGSAASSADQVATSSSVAASAFPTSSSKYLNVYPTSSSPPAAPADAVPRDPSARRSATSTPLPRTAPAARLAPPFTGPTHPPSAPTTSSTLQTSIPMPSSGPLSAPPGAAPTDFLDSPADITADSDTDVLPSAAAAADTSRDLFQKVWKDGQWFSVLDEQYLLPVFSNPNASRSQANRKAARATRRASTASFGNDDEDSSEAASPLNRSFSHAHTQSSPASPFPKR